MKWMVAAGVFGAAFIFRLIGGQQYLTLTVDSIYYATAAERAAEGHWAETLSAFWLPLVSYLAAPLVKLGLSSIAAVICLNGLCVVVAIVFVFAIAHSHAGSDVALIASFLFAGGSRLIQEASTIGSDCLWLVTNLCLFYILFFYRRVSRNVIVALLVAIVVWVRLPGILLGAWVCFLVAFRKDEHRRFMPLSAWTVSLVGLCLVYWQRTGYFAASLSSHLNHTYMNIEWMARDPLGFCRLYDGFNTILGDLFFLDPAASLPKDPALDPAGILAYHWGTLGRYLVGIFSVVPFPILMVAGWGLWKTVMQRDSRSFALGSVLWAFASTFGMVFSTVVPRYFLPVLPFVALYGGIGLMDIRHQWKRSGRVLTVIVFLVQGWVVTKETGFRSVWRNLTEPRENFAGEYLRQKEGPGKRIVSRWNFASAIYAGARWRVPPCESVDRITRYLDEKKIDFWIGPVAGESMAKELETRGILRREWESRKEVLYRIQRLP